MTPDRRSAPLPEKTARVTAENLPHFRTRLAAQRKKLIEYRRLRELGEPLPDELDGQLEIAIRDLRDLIAEVERENREVHRAFDLVRELSGNPKESDERATGRTTRLILRGMIAVSEGHDVIVIGNTLVQAAAIADKIKQCCQRWRIPVVTLGFHDRPLIHAKVLNDNRLGFRGVVLIDHAAIEAMEAKA